MYASAESTPDLDAQLAREVHRIVKDIVRPRAAVYWTDFTVSWCLAVAALGVYLAQPNSVLQVLAFFVAGFASYRLLVFTHELAHFRAGTFRVFRVVWNLLFGIPCLMPSFLYGDHKSHHVNHSYGTPVDGEYYPLARGPVRWIVAYLAEILVLPIAAVIRFQVLTAVSLLHPRIRRFVWEKCSSIATINPAYHRPHPAPKERVGILFQELGCFVWLSAVICLFFGGSLPWVWLPKVYLLFVFITAVNYIRALGSHRYMNDGEPISYTGQLLDSTTIPGTIFTELWAPLGMRYHALHHLVPSLPYHAAGTAHRRLMKELPPDSPYRLTLRRSLWSAIEDVVYGARDSASHEFGSSRAQPRNEEVHALGN